MKLPNESASEYRARVGNDVYLAEKAAQEAQAKAEAEHPHGMARQPGTTSSTVGGPSRPHRAPQAWDSFWSQPAHGRPAQGHVGGHVGAHAQPAGARPAPRPAHAAPAPGRARKMREPLHIEQEREARKILAMGPTANRTVEAVNTAFRAVIRASRGKIHPDHGGSGDEFKLVLAAKDHLVKMYEKIAELRARAGQKGPAPPPAWATEKAEATEPTRPRRGATAAPTTAGVNARTPPPRGGSPAPSPSPSPAAARAPRAAASAGSGPAGRRLPHQSQAEYVAGVKP